MSVEEQGYLEWAAGCQQRLLRSAFLLTGDVHRAEDLVQDALVKVALRWERLREGHPTAYARTVIARDNVSWWRRYRREALVADPSRRRAEDSAWAADHVGEVETRLVVLRALDRLTAGQRRVLVLRHFDDLSERETAEILGVSVGTVKSQNAAALARLRAAAPELLDLRGKTR